MNGEKEVGKAIDIWLEWQEKDGQHLGYGTCWQSMIYESGRQSRRRARGMSIKEAVGDRSRARRRLTTNEKSELQDRHGTACASYKYKKTPNNTPDCNPLAEEIESVLLELKKFSEMHFQCLILYFVNNVSFRGIGKVLRIHHATAKRYVNDAINYLMNKFEDRAISELAA